MKWREVKEYATGPQRTAYEKWKKGNSSSSEMEKVIEVRKKYGFHPLYRFKKSAGISREDYDVQNRAASKKAMKDECWLALKQIEVENFGTVEDLKKYKMYKTLQTEKK